MVGHLFQNYDTIYVRFFPTYTCNHSCYTIYVRFFVTYTCVLFPSIWPFSYKGAYICAQKSPYICVTNNVVYAVAESHRIRGTELYRQQKAPSCTIELKSNFSLNQAWPRCPRWFRARLGPGIRSLFIALTVVVVVGSPTKDLLESVDCLLRDCVRYFTNADRNNDRFS